MPRGALVLAVLTFLTYAMGLVRDRVFARTFGLSAELDAYNAAFILPELSMGMSADLEAAVEEGATIVRVGTAIFGVRERRGPT